MNIGDKIQNVQNRVNDPMCTDAIARMLLDDAQDAIFLRMYPWGVPENVTEVPARYQIQQCKLAARYFFRMGSEGEGVHIENGIHRHYGSVNDNDILQEIMQVVPL